MCQSHGLLPHSTTIIIRIFLQHRHQLRQYHRPVESSQPQLKEAKHEIAANYQAKNSAEKPNRTHDVTHYSSRVDTFRP